MIPTSALRTAFVASVFCASLAACASSQNSTAQHSFCPISTPFVDQLYPIPGATAVPTDVGQMVFASNGITRMELDAGEYPSGTIVRTKQEPLPNPLPTPIATGGPYIQYLPTRFAVSFTTLEAHTQYQVLAYTVPNPCYEGEPFPSGWTNIGSFTTQ
jgi:hypothetical protein